MVRRFICCIMVFCVGLGCSLNNVASDRITPDRCTFLIKIDFTRLPNTLETESLFANVKELRWKKGEGGVFKTRLGYLIIQSEWIRKPTLERGCLYELSFSGVYENPPGYRGRAIIPLAGLANMYKDPTIWSPQGCVEWPVFEIITKKGQVIASKECALLDECLPKEEGPSTKRKMGILPHDPCRILFKAPETTEWAVRLKLPVILVYYQERPLTLIETLGRLPPRLWAPWAAPNLRRPGEDHRIRYLLLRLTNLSRANVSVEMLYKGFISDESDRGRGNR